MEISWNFVIPKRWEPWSYTFVHRLFSQFNIEQTNELSFSRKVIWHKSVAKK